MAYRVRGGTWREGGGKGHVPEGAAGRERGRKDLWERGRGRGCVCAGCSADLAPCASRRPGRPGAARGLSRGNQHHAGAGGARPRVCRDLAVPSLLLMEIKVSVKIQIDSISNTEQSYKCVASNV